MLKYNSYRILVLVYVKLLYCSLFLPVRAPCSVWNWRPLGKEESLPEQIVAVVQCVACQPAAHPVPEWHHWAPQGHHVLPLSCCLAVVTEQIKSIRSSVKPLQHDRSAFAKTRGLLDAAGMGTVWKHVTAPAPQKSISAQCVFQLQIDSRHQGLFVLLVYSMSEMMVGSACSCRGRHCALIVHWGHYLHIDLELVIVTYRILWHILYNKCH